MKRYSILGLDRDYAPDISRAGCRGAAGTWTVWMSPIDGWRLCKRALNGELDNLALVKQSYDVIISHFSLHEISRERLPHTLFAFSQLLNNRGRVIFREPLDAMIDAEALKLMAKASGLRVTSINESKLLIGQVLEGVLKLNFCGL